MSPRPAVSVDEQLLTVQQVAERLNTSTRTIDDWRYYGTGPAYIKVGRLVRYSPADLEAWLRENRVAS